MINISTHDLIQNQKIEHATAAGFLQLYNQEKGTDFEISHHLSLDNKTPDFKCRNSSNQVLFLEVTLTQDRPDDIPALLGRKQHLSVEYSRTRPARSINEAKYSLIETIRKKSFKNYGENTYLLIRDTSPVDWSWEYEIADIEKEIKDIPLFFNKDIWMLNFFKTKIYKITYQPE